jgi:hypothetical protein
METRASNALELYLYSPKTWKQLLGCLPHVCSGLEHELD